MKTIRELLQNRANFATSMSLFITSLNSGSNGNCYYVGSDKDAVLIDAGLSCRETEKRMKRLGLEMSKVRAIFISHEHGDHICGLEVLATKHKLPIYITPATLHQSSLRLNANTVMHFVPYSPVSIGSLSVTAFPKYHDAIDPHSFVITGGEVSVGVFTDIGTVCTHVIDNFKKCHAVFLEANYDEDMLENGRYPTHLKKRISGDNGHLSNRQALHLFIDHKPAFMTHLFLSHISKQNNDPTLTYNLFSGHTTGVKIIMASRFKETAVYEISNEVSKKSHENPATVNTMQMSLF